MCLASFSCGVRACVCIFVLGGRCLFMLLKSLGKKVLGAWWEGVPVHVCVLGGRCLLVFLTSPGEKVP